jgi:predicted DNA-binding transcriptional regulator AlpA
MTAATRWTMESIRNLPPVLDLPEAARLLRIGRTSAYALAKRGQFPVPVVRAGKLYRVPTAGLLELLGLAAPPPPERVDVPHHFAAAACAPATSGASIHTTN